MASQREFSNDLERQRKRFAAVSKREARLRRESANVKIDSREVYAELDDVLEGMINAIPEIASELADELVGGRSAWPVDTGYSRSRWRSTEDGIQNDASYAEIVELRAGEPALDYVRDNTQRVVDEVIRRRESRF